MPLNTKKQSCGPGRQCSGNPVRQRPVPVGHAADQRPGATRLLRPAGPELSHSGFNQPLRLETAFGARGHQRSPAPH